ncbi:MAG TPA: molybdopterin-synthase adenylyltransferase MoeB [Bacteroidia bacterium]|jgi:adenylyltransferase/sulfurtransferase
MLSKEELSRYSRHLLLEGFGKAAQEKLKAAKALVIGAGGLGCPVLSYLAAAGVGTIGIADDDTVDESNLQRQVLYSTDDVGKKKASTAAQKLSRQNPFVKFIEHDVRIDTSNALEIFNGYDVVIDGSDNFATRYLVNDACVLLDKTLVFGSIHRFEGQVSVFNQLQDGKRGPTYRCLFPAPPAAGSVQDCAQAGVLGVLPGLIGTLQANEAIKVITGIGETLTGKILLVDALSMNFLSLEIKRTDSWKAIAPPDAGSFKKTDYAFFCGTSHENVKSIGGKELEHLLENGAGTVLLDVREEFEEPRLDEWKALRIPLREIEERLGLIPKDKRLVVFCRSGVRSRRAIEVLSQKGFSDLWNLEGGIEALQIYRDIAR